MKKSLLGIVTVFCLSVSYPQNIKLSRSTSKNDIIILNENYKIHFKKTDVLDAIILIDSVTQANHSKIYDQIIRNEIKSVQLYSMLPEDREFLELVSYNLGTYLLLKGKATILNGNERIKEIASETGIDLVQLDGSKFSDFLFSEPGSTELIYVGYVNKLLIDKN